MILVAVSLRPPQPQVDRPANNLNHDAILHNVKLWDDNE